MCELLFELLKNSKFTAQQSATTRTDRQGTAALPDFCLPIVLVAQAEIVVVVEVEPLCLRKMVGSEGAQLLLGAALPELGIDRLL